MELVFLGTSSARPTQKRGLSCICLNTETEMLIFDVGEGAQIMYQKAGLKWNKKTRIFITHMHGDHCLGLLGILQTMSLQGRDEFVTIFGPPGLEEFLVENMRMLGFIPKFPLAISEISGNGQILETEEYTVVACSSEHGVRAFAYLFKECDKLGEFYPEKALQLGIPRGANWHALQHGQDVTVGGKTVLASEVTGDPRKGIMVGISGDTRPNVMLKKFFADCDYLVFDSTFGSEHKERAKKTGHSTSAEAATLAKNAGVKTLILTHFSSRYTDATKLVKEAKKIHESVLMAEDLSKFIL